MQSKFEIQSYLKKEAKCFKFWNDFKNVDVGCLFDSDEEKRSLLKLEYRVMERALSNRKVTLWIYFLLSGNSVL